MTTDLSFGEQIKLCIEHREFWWLLWLIPVTSLMFDNIKISLLSITIMILIPVLIIILTRIKTTLFGIPIYFR